jgi:hypothetical protein
MQGSSVSARAVKKDIGTVWTGIRLGLFLVFSSNLSGWVYGYFYHLIAVHPLAEMVRTFNLPDGVRIENRLLGLSMLPVSYAVLASVAPLIGWWIYSRVEAKNCDKVGWGAAATYTASALLITYTNRAARGEMGFASGPIEMTIGVFLMMCFLMFFLGLGFSIAKLFRLKL